MIWHHYGDDGHYSGDNETRIVTFYDEQGEVTGTRPYNTEENSAADSEIELASRVDRIEDQVALLWATVFPVPDTPTEVTGVKTFIEWGGQVPPGSLVFDAGKVYRNVTKVPLTTPPSGFGWTDQQLAHLWAVELDPGNPPDPDPTHPAGYVGPWDALVSYAINDICSKDGRYWKCKIPHGAEYAGTWAPSVDTHAVWEDVGEFVG